MSEPWEERRVRVLYDGPIDDDVEALLGDFAAERGGKNLGAGSDGCTRDTDFLFSTLPAAKKFIEEVHGNWTLQDANAKANFWPPMKTDEEE